MALGEDKLILFGHSWGTLLSLLYLQGHPDRVQGLVLAAAVHPIPVPGDQTEIADRREFLTGRPAVVAALREAGVESDEQVLTPQQRWVRYRIAGLAASGIYRLERWRQVRSLYFNPPVAHAIDDSLGPYDLRGALQQSRVPITVIQGDRDYLFPAIRTWQQLARQASNIQIRVLSDAAHNPWIDEPEGFTNALDEGIRRSVDRG